MKNLWILTEERPKTSVLQRILEYFAKDMHFGFFAGGLKILPLLDENKCFAFTYEVIGFTCAKVDRVLIKIVSGTSSFTDFLVYYQERQPVPEDEPLYAIEETKTDDEESRNTGVFQRCTKFVFIRNYYPRAKKIMLYNLQVEQKKQPTDTYIFGTRLLKTLGVEVLGKNLNDSVFVPFKSIDEIIAFKQQMRKAPSGNVPITIVKSENRIRISGRLYKSGGLSHDPNIGALSIIAAVIRQLGWQKEIEIVRHGLLQEHIGSTNKFVQIANVLGISLQGLTLPTAKLKPAYWKYDMRGEKLGTIFIHIVVENFTKGYSVFENHAGCEKGYFITAEGEHIPLAKYSDRVSYKAGNKTSIVSIPDLVLLDISEKEAITIEGKKYLYRANGIKELGNYDMFDALYLKKYYPAYKIIRTVVLYGSKNESVAEIEVGFLLNECGKLVLGIRAPKLFREAIKNLLSYWA